MTEEFLNSNRVKRERMRKLEIQDKIVQMRQNLPKYNLEQIREYKMPYYDALVKNLQESGYISSSSFLQQLVNFQTTAREEAGPGSNVWMRPQLHYSNKELKYLTDELRKAEGFHFDGNHTKECDTFLRLGIHFAFAHPDWWWLGEQILVQSINVTGRYESLRGTFEALSRFAYSKFLIQNLKECDNAKEQLKIARELCQTKGQLIESYFPDEKGTLYMQVNYYTYKCLIKDVRNLMQTSYEKAIEMAILAKKRAAEACHKEGETKALMLKGICEMNIDDAKSAILSFNKALKLQQNNENKEGLCKVMIQLAKAYLMDNNTSQSLRILNALKNTAAEYHLHFYLAQAYKNLGEYYLNSGEYSIARKLLNKSLTFFEQEKDASSDIALVQILEAIAWGLELFPMYVELVHKSGNTAGPSGMENLNKLLDWKNSREPFWDETLLEPASFADMLAADHQVISPSTLKIEKYKEERKAARRLSSNNEDSDKKDLLPEPENLSQDLKYDGSKPTMVKFGEDEVIEMKDDNKTDVLEHLDEKETKVIELHSNIEQFFTTEMIKSTFPGRDIYKNN